LSSEKLEKLSNRFELDGRVELYYVMLAPIGERDKLKPPVGHEKDYCFDPATIIAESTSSSLGDYMILTLQ